MAAQLTDNTRQYGMADLRPANEQPCAVHYSLLKKAV